MEKNGFKEEKDHFIYSNGELQTSIKKDTFERTVKDVKEQFERFKESEKRYSELMQQEPKKNYCIGQINRQHQRKRKRQL